MGVTSLNFDQQDFDVIRYSRALAADAVQTAGNGHPGTAMSLAPIAYLLFQRHLRHDPSDPAWLARDRFVLSCGHSSLTLYTQLFLSGYGLEIADLREFRKLNSLTPGHPEFGHTPGVEITTGPLGAGISTAVGMAMAGRYVHGLLEPETTVGDGVFDHHVYVLCSDGDLQEGISAEACSLAGTQRLENLTVIYDDNRISIEGDTHLAFTEDVSARYRAYDWDVIEIDHLANGDVDLEKIDAALSKSRKSSKPTLIRVKSIIAWPAPNARNTAKSHGSALGIEEVAATKVELGIPSDEFFQMPDHLLAHARKVKARATDLRKDWEHSFQAWKVRSPERAELLDRIVKKDLPKLRVPEFSKDKEIATRAASGKVIQALAEQLPELWGGSADLADSNNTTIESSTSFLPLTSGFEQANPYGRVIHFGIREHAMGAILNGIALNGLSKAYAGTFLVFSDYMRGSVRLSALMDLPVTYVWTHDSIGLGEDGPTHQPIEHISALRAIPNFSVVRPADANEVAHAWLEILKRRKPAGLLLSRQNLPVFDREDVASAENVSKGAYILKEATGNITAIVIATGSEVAIALKAQAELAQEDIHIRVVSAPCLEWFEAQDIKYREEVLPPNIKLRVSIEAGVSQPWHKYLGFEGSAISLEHFGASANAQVLYEKFGITSDQVSKRIKSLM